MIAFLLVMLIAAPPRANVITVSATSGETGLRAAIEKARNSSATIVLGGGTYFLSEPIELTTDHNNCTIEAAAGETPILSGGQRITGWRKDWFNDRVCWSADVPDVKSGKWYFRELWVDGKRATRARRPDKGFFNIVDAPDAGANWEEGQHRFRFKGEDVPRGPYGYGAEAIIMMRWVESRLPLKSVDPEDHIATFTRKSQWVLQPNEAYWLEGDPSWMDRPGEWYLDRTSGTIYYIPLPGQSIDKIDAIAPRLSQLLALRGTTNIHVRGLTFSHTEWMLPDPDAATTQPVSGGFAQAATPVSAAVYGEGVKNSTFENCTIEHAGTYGIHLARGAQRNTITRCTLRDLGAGGVRIGEQSIRTEQADLSFANRVTDCEISDCGHVFPSAVGIWVGQSFDNVVAHNHVHDLYYSGISVGWAWGYGDSLNRGNVIEFNHVHHIGRRGADDGPILSDMGCLYLLGARNGTIVRNNHFHDVAAIKYGGWGIYLDEGSSNVLIEKNLVHDSTHGSFHLHYGKENIVRNNVFLCSSGEQQIQFSRVEDHLGFTFERNIVGWTNTIPLTIAGPKSVKYHRNAYCDITPEAFRAGGLTWPQWQAAGMDQHSIFHALRFANQPDFDFMFVNQEGTTDIGFEPFNIRGAGPRIDKKH